MREAKMYASMYERKGEEKEGNNRRRSELRFSRAISSPTFLRENEGGKGGGRRIREG